MSLCIVVRPADGGLIMCADTAISTEVMGQTYRVENFEDEEKIIEHNGTLVFCSGTYNKCTLIREYIRSLETVEVEKVQAYAQTLFNHDTSDDSTGIMILQKDGTLIGMLSAQDFKPTLMKWPAQGMGIHVLGFHMKEALATAREATTHCDTAIGIIGEAYAAVLCEEVGGHIWAYSCREDTPWRKVRGAFDEPAGIRKAVADNFASKVHCIISAQDFLLNDGTSMKSALNDNKSKVKGDYLDIRGANIVTAQGDTVLYIDETGIRWTQKYNPIKSQFSTSINGPWHDEFATNDEYRRDTSDGGTTWSKGYKFVAVDGKPGAPGTDGDPKGYLKSIKITEINKDNVKSALIEAATMAGANMYGGRFGDIPEKINGVYQDPNVWLEMGDIGGGYGLHLWHRLYQTTPMFSVWDNATGITTLDLKGREILEQDPSYRVKPKGKWDFSGATEVKGVPIRFGE